MDENKVAMAATSSGEITGAILAQNDRSICHVTVLLHMPAVNITVAPETRLLQLQGTYYVYHKQSSETISQIQSCFNTKLMTSNNDCEILLKQNKT